MNPVYDLEERSFHFAKDVRKLIQSLPKNILNNSDFVQFIKSSGSIGANYIEANENLSRKDFIYRLKISRKEAKESLYWLRILKAMNSESDISDFDSLIKEASELRNILSSIILKSKK